MVYQSVKNSEVRCNRKRMIAIALTASVLGIAPAYAVDTSMFSVKGFGTVGVVHSNSTQADFVATQFQPNGSGYTRGWDMSVDSLLGVQLDAKMTDKLSAVVQVVSKHQYDDTWRPMVEWANVKYQFTPELSARLGRIVLPAFMLSDTRMVGYSNPWVRPPEEVYFNSLTTNSDGGDVTFHNQFSGLTNTVQAFYGKATGKSNSAQLKANPDWGINDSLEIDSLTLRASYIAYKLNFVSSGLEQLYDGINQFAAGVAPYYPNTATEAASILDTYHLDDMKVKVYTLGASYDPGEWFAMGEGVHVKGDSFLADSNSFYVTSGYRFDRFTPYITFAKVKTDKKDVEHFSEAGLPAAVTTYTSQFNAAFDALVAHATANQQTISVGLRWDFMPSADLKIQFDRKHLSDGSNGRLLLPANVGDYQGSSNFNVISAAVDFVF